MKRTLEELIEYINKQLPGLEDEAEDLSEKVQDHASEVFDAREAMKKATNASKKLWSKIFANNSELLKIKSEPNKDTARIADMEKYRDEQLALFARSQLEEENHGHKLIKAQRKSNEAKAEHSLVLGDIKRFKLFMDACQQLRTMAQPLKEQIELKSGKYGSELITEMADDIINHVVASKVRLSRMQSKVMMKILLPFASKTGLGKLAEDLINNAINTDKKLSSEAFIKLAESFKDYVSEKLLHKMADDIVHHALIKAPKMSSDKVKALTTELRQWVSPAMKERLEMRDTVESVMESHATLKTKFELLLDHYVATGDTHQFSAGLKAFEMGLKTDEKKPASAHRDIAAKVLDGQAKGFTIGNASVNKMYAPVIKAIEALQRYGKKKGYDNVVRLTGELIKDVQDFSQTVKDKEVTERFMTRIKNRLHTLDNSLPCAFNASNFFSISTMSSSSFMILSLINQLNC